MTTGQLVLVAAVTLAAALGGWRLARDGRFRGTRRLTPVAAPSTTDAAASSPAPDVAPILPARPVADALAERGIALGERATLLQFSSAFCAPCRATRRVLGEVAAVVPGVAHVEIDAEEHLDLVRRLGILRTPTTLVLDATGQEVRRAAGAPRRADVLGALSEAVS